MPPRPGPSEPIPTEPFAIDTGTAQFVVDRHDADWVSLVVNDVPSSRLSLSQPELLDFDYMAWMMDVLVGLYPPDTPLRGFHLGGGACALPRAIAHRYPASRHLAVEIDAQLAAAVRRYLPLPRAPRLRIRVGDAFEALASKTPGTCDVIVRDVFAGDTTPARFTTDRAAQLVAQALAPGGVYLANCIDGPGAPFAKREAATLALVFPYVAAIGEPPQLRGRRRGNVVLVARAEPMPPDIENDLGHRLVRYVFTARLITGSDRPAWAGGARPLIEI
jgi:spermidine synthase